MQSITIKKLTDFIKLEANRLGFFSCGIAKAEFLKEEAPLLEQWLKNGMHGKMDYMERHFDLRLDPEKLFPGAKSIVSLLYNYYPEEKQNPYSEYKISKYAYGRDYHKVIRKKLKEFLNSIKTEVGEINGRGFVDSAPIMDKTWAQKSGLGWIGKNSNLLNRQTGSFFFIANLVLDIELEYDGPVKDFCGTCTRCIDACPTNAITPYKVDGSKCISYLTIELKDEIPQEFKGKYDNWVFGCDICQDVCPWNRFSKPHTEPDFKIRKEIKEFTGPQWEEISEEIFDKVFSGNAVKRTGYKGFKRNVEFLKRDRNDI